MFRGLNKLLDINYIALAIDPFLDPWGSEAQIYGLLHSKLGEVQEQHGATLRAMTTRLEEERRLRLALQARVEQLQQRPLQVLIARRE